MSPKALPFISLLATFWGTSLVVSRFALGQYDSLAYIALRILIAGLAYLVITSISRKRRFPRGWDIWKQGTILGIFSTAVPMTGIVSSLQYQSSGVTSLILTLSPAITVLLAHFFLADEKLNMRKALGIGLALSGGAFLILLGENGLPDVSQSDPRGYLLALSAVIIGSFMVVYIRRNMQHLDSYDVSSIRMWVAGFVMLPIAFFVSGFDLSRVDGVGVAALIYAGLVGTFAGMLLDFYNIKRFGATASAMVSVLIPIVAIVTGTLLLGEVITPVMIVAMVLIIGGVAVLNTGPDKESLPHVPEDIQV